MDFRTLDTTIGSTPLVRLNRLAAGAKSVVLAKLESHNPGGSVKDRAALGMIRGAEARGEIKPGDVLIEPTSGNTGIALAMVAAMRGYRMLLIMPDNMSPERRALMKAYGADIILTPGEGGMEAAIDLARCMEADGEGRVLDQFANADNPRAHYEHTGPEIWRDTRGKLTHFVSAMGTTGTIMGCSRYLKERSAKVQIVGVQPGDGASIPGIRRWCEPYLPKFYEPRRIDRIVDVTQEEAEQTAVALAAEEGIFGGISAGGAVAAALKIAHEVERAVIVTIICDSGSRYLSSKVFPA